jgi:hypothetical protein
VGKQGWRGTSTRGKKKKIINTEGQRKKEGGVEGGI